MKIQLPSLHGVAQRIDTMRQVTFSAPRMEIGRSRGTPMASRRRRILLIAVVLSVAVHLAAALLIVLLPRVLPQEARPQEPGTVELLMVEKKGAGPDQAGQPLAGNQTPNPPENKAETRKAVAPKEEAPKEEAPKQEEAPGTETPAPAPDAVPAPRMPENGAEPAPPASEQAASNAANPDSKAAPKQAQAQSIPPPSEAPVFNLEGTESDSNAIAMGAGILPATPDNRFRNRPPPYPAEAEMRGQHGTVVILIHVSESGVATGVDVAESSGVAALDQAAVTAARKWRFRPAMQAGRTIPFDMPFRFVFEAY
jgi:protein TonB